MELKLAGSLLILAGAIIMLAAFIMLDPLPPRTVFCLAGLAVEFLGLVLIARAHIVSQKRRHD